MNDLIQPPHDTMSCPVDCMVFVPARDVGRGAEVEVKDGGGLGPGVVAPVQGIQR